jgi:potassium-transporting ATPase KdpC subunit
MKELLIQSIRLTIVLTILTGLVYPLVITGLAQWTMHSQANGSLILRDGQAVGSALLAQPFSADRYFWPRPSAAGYATVPSGASNWGPTSEALRKAVQERAARIRATHGLPADTPVPADLVFASGSGLDPHISPEAAELQVTRVARARGLDEEGVRSVVDRLVEPPQWGLLGEARVNVLRLNLAMDQLR